MIRITDIALLLAAIGGAVYTYQIKHEAENAARHIKTLHAQIAAQDRKIALLEADWALETGPARLEHIAEQFKEELQLAPMESSQIIDSTELPGFRLDRTPVSDETYAGKDRNILTGGVGDLIQREVKGQ